MSGKGVAAVNRALSIIESFQEGESSLSLRQLASRTGLNKATIIRLIASLESFGCITRIAQGEYALGPSLLRYGTLYQSSFHLAEHVIPILRDMVRKSGETAAFFVREGDMRVCLHMVASTSALRSHLREGDRQPLLPGGTGKILLAFSNDAPQAFADIRKVFIATNLGERHPEIASVAAPVLRTNRELVGAISLSGPIGHFSKPRIEELAHILLEAAGEITRRCGGDPALFHAAFSRSRDDVAAAESGRRCVS